MNESFETFLSLPEQGKRDVFEAAASRLDTLPGYVEKDFWVCLVLDTLYNRLPDGHPNLLFKGGTSLSKAFGLIERFSEDIDLVVYRDGLGFEGERGTAARLAERCAGRGVAWTGTVPRRRQRTTVSWLLEGHLVPARGLGYNGEEGREPMGLCALDPRRHDGAGPRPVPVRTSQGARAVGRP